MTPADDTDKLDSMIRRWLKTPSTATLDNSTKIKSLCTADWRIIDLGIAVEAEFGIELSADAALALETVGAWRKLIRT